MSVTPLFGVQTVTAAPSAAGVAHLAVSRSARIRLAPVADALSKLGVPQTTVERTGDVDEALSRARPAFALIAGDGDEAVEAAMAADRLGVPIARIGAGLRCDDRAIAGEINRIVLDELAQRLYVDGETAAERLHAERFEDQRVVRAGTTLADSAALRRIDGSAMLADLRLARGAYILATVHKPENTGDPERLRGIARALVALAGRIAVIVCVDAAVQARLETVGALQPLRASGAIVRGPLAHTGLLALQASARAVVTDSAGVQEETTLLGVPCFTLGRSTERAMTLTHGTNVLLGDDPREIAEAPLGGLPDEALPIPLWDGRASRRIAADLAEWTAA